MVLFNFPLLIVWDRDATVLGLPLLPVALFAIWAALITVRALGASQERSGKRVLSMLHPSGYGHRRYACDD